MKPKYINPDFNPLDAQPLKRARKINTIKPDTADFVVPKVQHFVGKRDVLKPQTLSSRVLSALVGLAVGKSITVRNLEPKQYIAAMAAVQKAQKSVRKRYTTRSIAYNPKKHIRSIRIWRII